MPPRSFSRPPGPLVRYPNHYTWLVLLSALDIWITWIVLHRGGHEANALAAVVLHHFGRGGFVAFKFLIIAFVVTLCEIVGKRNDRAGRQLATCAVAITIVPLVLGVVQLVGAR
jgi:hypothetical protein